MIASVSKVETVHEAQRFAVESADREHVGRHVENFMVLFHRFIERVGIHHTAADPFGFDRDPSIGTVVFFLFENKLATLPLVEMMQLGKATLHLLEEMQNGFSPAGQIHFRLERYIGIKVITQRTVWIHSCCLSSLLRAPAVVVQHIFGPVGIGPLDPRPVDYRWSDRVIQRLERSITEESLARKI